ncbi:hypothetical protein [Pedobacter rhizosphaerae]|uniref:Uncharacterized protein n=1 Tax=Pedobacter rhizosphaerae TaxID=390241 RepID=A0A1H9U1B1_9SPHI|nr:hypothetical protein [Pedobacter rhizosphaerae]SES02863.1 hypothetical protein SAMN04488023_12618 [Pedobacter rhizosphaerae]
MATITQFQAALKEKSKRLLVEHSLGKNLIDKIESAGGRWTAKEGSDFYEFNDVPAELKPELDKKLRSAQQRLHDMDQQWHQLIR